METAKANDLEPYWYLRYLFANFPLAENRDYEKLLPWNLTMDELKNFVYIFIHKNGISKIAKKAGSNTFDPASL
ncbi:MAG: transposase domain-containing protein [Spirochaetes bacterium]|nr:transposase domain-containing protein [Spirochaetota bacterium]